MASGLIPPAWFMASAAPDVDALYVSFMFSRSEGRRIRLVRAQAAEKIGLNVSRARPQLGKVATLGPNLDRRSLLSFFLSSRPLRVSFPGPRGPFNAYQRHQLKFTTMQGSRRCVKVAGFDRMT